jgi:8-oxo-dGTP pyrophosphatase MutT (NUDIX family)
LSQIILTSTANGWYDMIVHHIQRQILEKLLYAESLNYAGMRPVSVESNHFAYHLDQLIHEGLIVKHDKQYTLSTAGLRTVDRMSQQKMVDRLQPHIVVAVDVTTPDGQTLLFKRNFQPYIYRVGFPLGKTHYEETIADAAVRELYEKTGLQDIPLTYRGHAYIDARQDGQTISKVLYHIFHGDVAAPLSTSPPSPRGECLWGDAANFSDSEAMPGFHQVKQLLSGGPELFFEEFIVNL